MSEPPYAGLDLLATAVVVVSSNGHCRYLNLAAEQLFGQSRRSLTEHRFAENFISGQPLEDLLSQAIDGALSEKSMELVLERVGRTPLEVSVSATAVEPQIGPLILEFREFDQRKRIEREVRILENANANRELLRNLAHEVKNPLGGIRGAAQLLQAEHPEPMIAEFTEIIIKESDRLQRLLDRLLTPHQQRRELVELNIHEVLEWVRTLISAEFGTTLAFVRDYDASLPDMKGDREPLIQAVLNIVRNAAQALKGQGQIILRTRVARQVLIGTQRHKLALELHVIDDGPGIPAEIRDRIFFPLVTGREGGTGLGLSLAQTFVQQHGGLVECESRPGQTDFRILLPLG